MQKDEHKQGNLVQESTTRESAFATKIADLQIEIKNLKKQDRHSRKEIELHKEHLTNLQKEYEKLNEKKEQYFHETRELKKSEARFNEEYNLLEEEYTLLQKSLSKMKQTLVEYEGLKVENKSLLDEVSYLSFTVDRCPHNCSLFFEVTLWWNIFLSIVADLRMHDLKVGSIRKLVSFLRQTYFKATVKLLIS